MESSRRCDRPLPPYLEGHVGVGGVSPDPNRVEAQSHCLKGQKNRESM